MVGFISQPIPLPDNVTFTERSRKFYDGMYRWDSEGFVDDRGVCRGFDCYDPVARAPTPLPPMLLGDDDEEGATQLHRSRRSTSNPRDSDQKIENSLDISRIFTFAINGGKTVTVRHNQLFRGHADSEHMISKMEGILIASRHAGVSITMEECYQLCAISDSADKGKKVGKREITPPSSPLGTKTTVSETRELNAHQAASTPSKGRRCNKNAQSSKLPPSSPASDLSDCPSDISSWDMGNQKTNRRPTAVTTYQRQQEEEEEIEELKRRLKTRGVAQKVKEGAEKPPSSQSNRTAPSLVSLHLASASITSRRRSSRQANAQGAFVSTTASTINLRVTLTNASTSAISRHLSSRYWWVPMKGINRTSLSTRACSYAPISSSTP
ncbi:hypothetical protein EJ02DRAFT_508465 [Clathrospora elynae]|uniref:Uncharacterized protein n=1 Tax=Clathrospora elynae TaxID=706981 RepID=A0A6A5T0Q3_9PLEO|nr:hypothetical protein EJ02DRAFT_508465 [Clathrospora elynae]